MPEKTYTISPVETLNVDHKMRLKSVVGLNASGEKVADGRTIYLHTALNYYQVHETFFEDNYYLRVTEAYHLAKFYKVKVDYTTSASGEGTNESELIPLTSVFKFSTDKLTQCKFTFYFYDVDRNQLTHPEVTLEPTQEGNYSHITD